MTHLSSERHELGEVLLVEVVERPQVLAVADQPVDRREVLPLRQLLVQPPEHLHDPQRRRGNGVGEIATRWRHAVNKNPNSLFVKVSLYYCHPPGGDTL